MAGMIQGTPSESTAAGTSRATQSRLCLTLHQGLYPLSLPLVQAAEQTQPPLPELWKHPEQLLLLRASLLLPLLPHVPCQRSPQLLPSLTALLWVPCAPFLRKEQLLLLPGNPRVDFTAMCTQNVQCISLVSGGRAGKPSLPLQLWLSSTSGKRDEAAPAPPKSSQILAQVRAEDVQLPSCPSFHCPAQTGLPGQRGKLSSPLSPSQALELCPALCTG